MTRQTDYDAHRAMVDTATGRMDVDSPMTNGIFHADHMEPPLQARDGWHSLAVIFCFWFGVFIAAPFAFGFGGALAQVYLRGLI